MSDIIVLLILIGGQKCISEKARTHVYTTDGRVGVGVFLPAINSAQCALYYLL